MKLQILIQGFLIVILATAQQWISNRVEHQVLNAALERANTVTDGAINGLNTLMITKVGNAEVISDPKARTQFVQKMGISEMIKEMRVFRAPQLDDQFPKGLPQ